MHFRLVARVLLPMCGCGLAAQGAAAQLDAGATRIEAKEWQAAATLLLAIDVGSASVAERERLAALLRELGEALGEEASFELALQVHEAEWVVLRALHSTSDPAGGARCLNDLAVSLQALGRPAEALQRAEQSLAMVKRQRGDGDHPDVAAALHTVASCLQALGRPAEALSQFEHSLAMNQRVFGDGDHPGVAAGLNNVAACLEALGRPAEALLRYEQSLAMERRQYGDRDHPDVARGLNNVASCLASLGRAAEALPHYEHALAMRRRLYGERDHPDVASSLNNVAFCQRALGRADAALPQFEQSLAMWRRLFGDRDHPRVALGLQNVAECLHSLGRAAQALPRFEQSLAMRKRLFGDGDHPDVASGLQHVAACLQSLGRAEEALPRHELALAMNRRLHGDRDHADVALGLQHVAFCLQWLGRVAEALPHAEQSLAMHQRLYGDGDHPGVASSLNGVGLCLQALGRAAEALPQFEQSLAMNRRLHPDCDHPDVATSLNHVAVNLQLLGRAAEALPHAEQSLAMNQRLFGQRDHPEVARGLEGVAVCLLSVGRSTEALSRFERSLAMNRRLHEDRDHPGVAMSLNNVAFCLNALGRTAEALPRFEQSLAMAKRLHGDRDHPGVAAGLHNVAACLRALGRAGDALPHYEQALAMERRLYGDRDHPDVASSAIAVAECLHALGRDADAFPLCVSACDIVERLRGNSRLSGDLRQSFFDVLKRGGAFERLQSLVSATDVPRAFAAAERSRGRDLLDLLEQQRGDPLHEAELRAMQRGDEVGATNLRQLRANLTAAEVEGDRLLHALTRLADVELTEAERDAQHRTLLAESDANSRRRRQLLDERARLLADVLPVGRVRTAVEIQGALREGEVLLEFTVSRGVALLYMLSHAGEVEAVPLPTAHAAVQRLLPGLLARSSNTPLRGRDPEQATAAANAVVQPAHELFTALIPTAVWERIRASKRVFVAPHRELHRLPFELLVTAVKDGKPVRWIDSGPPVAYVPSGSALHWLRQRAKEARDDKTSVDLVAVGDPGELAVEPEVPEEGAFVVAVNAGGEGARVGLQPGDVLTSYDGQPLVDDKSLRDLRMAAERAIEDGKRDQKPIPIVVWRRGNELTVDVQPGLLGVQVRPGKARSAFEASLGGERQLARITRSGDIERLRHLPPLQQARAEARAIAAVFTEKQREAKLVLGADATEPAVFDLAAKAKYLHFACHGIAEEYAGQSLSMLVLSPPPQVLPGDDGLLKLGDLLHAWRGRLAATRLVVLSACRTNVGPTLRDEAPQALPLGFLFAGAPAVISSLWAVDDASTKELMTDFYSRLLAGEQDQLAAFAAAKKALASKHPDPFHWAPFLYLGSPD